MTKRQGIDITRQKTAKYTATSNSGQLQWSDRNIYFGLTWTIMTQKV